MAINKFPRATITGCNARYEHTIEWWFKRYRGKNRIPVIFANFGLTQQKLELVNNLADVVLNIDATQQQFFMGLKQKAVIESSKYTEIALWLDLDCEVFQPLDSFFNYCKDKRSFAISRDIPKLKYPGDLDVSKNQFQAGVFVAAPSNDLLRLWWEKSKDGGNDQKIISDLINENYCPNVDVLELPPSLHCARMMLDSYFRDFSNYPAVVHWTGEIGNQIIEERMSSD